MSMFLAVFFVAFGTVSLVLAINNIIQEDKNENESDKAPQTGNGVLMVTVLLTAADSLPWRVFLKG